VSLTKSKPRQRVIAETVLKRHEPPGKCGEMMAEAIPIWASCGKRGRRDSAGRGEGRTHIRALHKANGAGIAADPTLTDAWTLRSQRGMWRTNHLAVFRARLAPDVWPWFTRLAAGFPEFRHRRSHRHPAFAPALLHRPEARRPWVAPPCTVAWPRRRSLYRFVLRWLGAFAFPPHIVPARFPACPAALRRAPLKRDRLPSAEALCMPSLDRRGDMCRRHLGIHNRLKFRALRLFLPSGLCPEDRLKVRLNRRSGNICAPQFSTFASIACGHEWISQRFVAFRAKLR